MLGGKLCSPSGNRITQLEQGWDHPIGVSDQSLAGGEHRGRCAVGYFTVFSRRIGAT